MGLRLHRSSLVGLLILGLVLLWVLPLMLRQPLTLDAIAYDICARRLFRGDVLYRDIFDNNFPGVVWIHAAVRQVGGPSPLALRLFDLAVAAAIAVLLLGWVVRAGASGPTLPLTAALLVLFYSGRMEWCHCQRDTWMLLPVLAALRLRWSQCLRLGLPHPRRGPLLAAGILEGVLWGAAIWIKPVALAPAAAAWLMSLLVLRGGPSTPGFHPVAADASGLLLGGLLAGAAGASWLICTGAWASFWDIMLHWNRDYNAGSDWIGKAGIWRDTFGRFFPWGLAVAAAWPLAAARVWQTARTGSAALDTRKSQALLGAVLLAWSAQALLVQRPFDYVQVPVVFLSVALLAGEWPPRRQAIASGMLVILAAVALLTHPLLRLQRLRLWAQCWQPHAAADLRHALSQDRDFISWQSLDRVADFLRSRASDRELACFSNSSIPLYLELDLDPPTRYVYLFSTLALFPSQAPRVWTEVKAGPHRFLVTDLVPLGLSPEEVAALPPEGEFQAPYPTLAWQRSRYPWSLPIVFRAGRYLVHLADGPAAARPAGPP